MSSTCPCHRSRFTARCAASGAASDNRASSICAWPRAIAVPTLLVSLAFAKAAAASGLSPSCAYSNNNTAQRASSGGMAMCPERRPSITNHYYYYIAKARLTRSVGTAMARGHAQMLLARLPLAARLAAQRAVNRLQRQGHVLDMRLLVRWRRAQC